LEAHKLCIQVKTRHNEVDPNQFELAPIFEETNLANDHNLLLMTLMSEVARRHNFHVLLHEKPFSGINGSGKHNNWSLGTDKGDMLFSPGKTAMENLRFLTFVVNVMVAVHRHNALLKASIMSATNAHRLGANEAPPAIISIFLGKQLSNILEKIENMTAEELSVLTSKAEKSLGLAQIPELMLDNTDRNRTSPFAFTGNRFEFRAVGSSANCAGALIALNAAVADQLDSFHKAIIERMDKGEDLQDAILAELRLMVKASKAIHFDGNGYSDEWKEEAARRGLDCETSAPRIFDAYLSDESVKMFGRTGVFSPVELAARNEVKWEMYTKKIQIEARVLGDLAINHIVPVATRYQSMLVDNVVKLKELFPGEKGQKIVAHDLETIERMSDHLEAIKAETDKMIDARKEANKIENERAKAIAYHDTVVPPMEVIRYHIDKLELMVDNKMWPLPKYRELLFIR
ncbi:MAG: glutamine synthetase type III, partial [Muribaculaceae bacterium]|nr:glutamine synthetase type III [Muribaculaceae bacterium]